jgi:DnaJ-class molecular chaperone
MTCKLCNGTGNLICVWPLEWFDCPKCEGNGTIIQFGPSELAIVRPVKNNKFIQQGRAIFEAQLT